MSYLIKIRKVQNVLFALLCCMLLSVVGCKDQAFDQHYERPDWLKGNALEVLQQRGTYTHFLEGLRKVGFESLVNGKGIVTVMAPSDVAFERYFQEKGVSSISEFEHTELKKLISYHLVYYSYNQSQFANFRPQGQAVEELNTDGLYYKHRTYSRDPISNRTDPADGKRKTIFHKERFLPVMSSYLFDTKGITAADNYQYFYPNSEWKGDNGGFNVSNASVEEYALPTDNGYVYLIDAVLDPLETIYTEMTSREDYSKFVELYDKFIDFWYDEQTTFDFAELGDSLFVIRHTRLPEIASEWSYNGEGALPDFANLPSLTGDAFNVFAPNDQALNAFFDTYWSGYYNSINDIGFIPIAYLLDNHVYQGSIVFPGEINQGLITSPYGNVISFDTEGDVVTKKICVNGAFYGLGSVTEPAMFQSVTGPAFKDPQYQIFLFMLDKTDMIGPLSSDAVNFTVFMPSDEVVTDVLFENTSIYWDEGNPKILGDEQVLVDGNAGDRVPMSVASMQRFVNNHIINVEIQGLSDKSVYTTRNNFSYIYIDQEQVNTNLSYNKKTPLSVEPIAGDWTNGRVYATDKAFIKEPTPIKSLIASAGNGTNELNNISEFASLLADAGLTAADRELDFLLGDQFLMLAPSNEVIRAARDANLIPTDDADLVDYLKYYFVPFSINSFTDYPFPGFGVQGSFSTSQLASGSGYAQLEIVDQGNTLAVRDQTGTLVNVISEFPAVYSDGAIYVIDEMIKAN